MLRLFALLVRWFPSTPPALRGRAAAAASTDSCSRRRGEAAPGAGHQTPAPVTTTSTPLAGAGQTPEGARPGTRAPSGPPRCETDLFWEPAREHAFEFSDGRLGALLNRWRA